MALSFKGIVSRFSKQGNGSELAVRLTSNGSVAVAQTEPHGLEMARAGRRFYGGCQAAASGLAPVTAFPSTTAALVLFNGEDQGSGICYYVDEIHATLGSGTAAAGLSIWCLLTSAKIAAPTAATNYSTQSASVGSKTSKAIWGTAITVAGAWRSVGGAGADWAAAANFGQGISLNPLPNGMLVKPGYALAITALSGTGTTPLYTFHLGWTEVECDVE